jgi:hypothetical protein
LEIEVTAAAIMALWGSETAKVRRWSETVMTVMKEEEHIHGVLSIYFFINKIADLYAFNPGCWNLIITRVKDLWNKLEKLEYKKMEQIWTHYIIENDDMKEKNWPISFYFGVRN